MFGLRKEDWAGVMHRGITKHCVIFKAIWFNRITSLELERSKDSGMSPRGAPLAQETVRKQKTTAGEEDIISVIDRGLPAMTHPLKRHTQPRWREQRGKSWCKNGFMHTTGPEKTKDLGLKGKGRGGLHSFFKLRHNIHTIKCTD